MHHYQVELTDEQRHSAITTYGPIVKRHMDDGTMSDQDISSYFDQLIPEGKAGFLHAKRMRLLEFSVTGFARDIARGFSFRENTTSYLTKYQANPLGSAEREPTRSASTLPAILAVAVLRVNELAAAIGLGSIASTNSAGTSLTPAQQLPFFLNLHDQVAHRIGTWFDATDYHEFDRRLKEARKTATKLHSKAMLDALVLLEAQLNQLYSTVLDRAILSAVASLKEELLDSYQRVSSMDVNIRNALSSSGF